MEKNSLTSIKDSLSKSTIELAFIRLYGSLYAIADGDIEFMRHWFLTKNTALNDTPAELCKKRDGIFQVNEYLNVIRADRS